MNIPHQPDDPLPTDIVSAEAAAHLAHHVATVAAVLAANVAAMNNTRKEETKQLVKEALKEWLDEKFAAWGKWSIMSVAAAGFVALSYFIFYMHGWRSPR